MSKKPICKCGCWSEAVWRVDGFDYDPRAPGGKGKPFSEPCCDAVADYLTEASAECGFPCTKTPIESSAT